MSKRSGKFYRKNEKEIMKMLGLKPVAGSGSGWVCKEDGTNDKVLCQLKSTDKESIKVNRIDMDKLEYHASVEHKIPIFAIQFINRELYLLVRPVDLSNVAKYIKTGEVVQAKSFVDDIQVSDNETTSCSTKIIKSSESARLKYKKQNEQKYKKKERSAT